MKKLLLIYLFFNMNTIFTRNIYEINQEISQIKAKLDHKSIKFRELSMKADEALSLLYEYSNDPDLDSDEENSYTPDINIAIQFIENYVDLKLNKYRVTSLLLSNRLIDLEAEKRILHK